MFVIQANASHLVTFFSLDHVILHPQTSIFGNSTIVWPDPENFVPLINHQRYTSRDELGAYVALSSSSN